MKKDLQHFIYKAFASMTPDKNHDSLNRDGVKSS